jgi:hypothetical protein
VVAFSVGQGFTQAVNTTPSKLLYTAAATIDTHGAYSTTNSNYTVPVSGIYRVDLAAVFTSGTGPQVAVLNIVKNGSGTSAAAAFQMAASSTTYYFSAQRTLSLNAGDVIDVRAYVNTGTATVANDATANIFSLNRLSGPSVIAATESVYASYYTAAGQTIPNSTATVVVFGTKTNDSHNAYNSSTGVYTIPVSGRYVISSMIEFSGSTVVNKFRAIDITGTQYLPLGSKENVAITTAARVSGASQGYYRAGDTVTISAYQDTGQAGGLALTTASAFNHFEITRVGN